MTTKITADNIEQSTLDILDSSGPAVANVKITSNSYAILDDTAVSTDGGYIIVNGSNFEPNVNVLIDQTAATSVTRVSATQLRVQVPALSAGSKILYVVNSDTGATTILLNGVTYSGTPTWVTGSTLTEGAVAEAISIQLSASSDSNVSYQLQAGSTLPAGLTLAANGLLSGTVTGITVETLYNFTVEAVDTENQESPRSFTITVTVGDEYFSNTVLLLNADNNTFITDASDNTFTITPVADTRPSAFSPYNTSWSNFFDGNGDSLTVGPSAEFTFGTGDWTIEYWVYVPAWTGLNTLFHINTSSSADPPYGFLVRSSSTVGQWQIFLGDGAAWVINNVGVQSGIGAGQWQHHAHVRNAGTYTFYINGVSRYSAVNTTNIPYTYAHIGRYVYFATGYISNFRIVKGTAVYTAAFTPPTEPLTAISGTSLLTCQSNRFIDNSTNNFTITRNGDVKVTTFGPFAETDTTTGSGYFDGAGDYLTVNNFNGSLGAGNYTIEFWFNTNDTNNFEFFAPTVAFAGPALIGIGSTQISVQWEYGSGTGFSWTTGNVFDNSWHHLALVRNGTTVTLYVDGISRASGTNSPVTDYSGYTTNWTLGYGNQGAGRIYLGYMSDFRVVAGTAVYTENFSNNLPTSPLPAVSGTQLLTLQNRVSYNNSQPIDESGIRNIITRVGNASAGTFSPHVPTGWSAYFDGTGDYLTTSTSEDFNLGTGDFTFECWARFDELSTSSATGDGFLEGGAIGDFDFAYVENSLRIARYGIAWDHIFAFTPNLNQWYHIAYTRSTGTLRVFVDGALIGSAASSQSYTISGTVFIGSDPDLTYRFMKGYISNLRLVKGTAVYTAAFTPPTAPLEPIAGTSLLTLRGPSFTDDGANRFAITRNGDTRITPFSPFAPHTRAPLSHSVYFDGTGDYLTLADNTAFTLTSDFTIECFFFTPVLPTSTQTIAAKWAGGGQEFIFDYGVRSGSNARTVRFFWGPHSLSVPLLTSPNDAFNVGEWVHAAIVRSGSTITMYINGVSVVSGNNGTAASDLSQPLYIGAYGAGPSDYLNGYISNFRIVKGTAVYTAAFTPPTALLEATQSAGTNIAAITGTSTSLLTCQSPTVTDNSSNEFALTVNGNSQPTQFNPFGETVTTGVEYSPVLHGGSAFVDSSGGDYLSQNGGPLSLNTTAWTVECWIYPTSFINGQGIWGASNGGGAQQKVAYQIDSSNITLFIQGSPAISATAPALNQWTHILVSRAASGTGYIYYNGVLQTSGAVGTSTVSSPFQWFTNGEGGTTGMAGYISGGRVSNIARYTGSNFSVPSLPPTNDGNTNFLTNFTNAAIQDKTGRNVLETGGNARVVNGVKKFGSGAIAFDGSGDYLLGKSSENYQFRTGDFTIEFWLYRDGNNVYQTIVDTRASGAATPWAVLLNSSNQPYILITSDLTSTIPVPLQTWTHVAISRSSGTLRIFVDGVQGYSNTHPNDINPTGSLYIGRTVDNLYYLDGYIDDLRITRGVARYTATFTPPASAHKVK